MNLDDNQEPRIFNDDYHLLGGRIASTFSAFGAMAQKVAITGAFSYSGGLPPVRVGFVLGPGGWQPPKGCCGIQHRLSDLFSSISSWRVPKEMLTGEIIP